MGTLVTYRHEGAIATITMDDGKVNALSTAMLGALNDAFDQATADEAAVVLTGRPGRFSAGFDLGVLGSGGPEVAPMVRGGFELAARVFGHPRPVVVACTGHAVAMGVFLLLAGDYRIGTAGPYKITANEVAIGVTMPRAAVELCRQRLVPPHFERAVLTAEAYAPDDAVPAGFLDRAVPADELAGAAREVAEGLARLDAAAYAATKQRVRERSLAAMRAAIETDAADLQKRAAAAAG